MKIATLFGAILLFTQSSFAGGWSSGGGELIKDSHNPWFLENSSSVTYCIDIDTASISASEESINHWVNRAIQDWTLIFAQYQSNHPGTHLKVTTRGWVKLDCSIPVDLKFKFGWNTLEPEEKTYLSQNGDPHRFIALSVRTAYDQKLLHGTGFLYLGSDLGPDAFSQGSGQMNHPWKYPSLIYYELLHELGHIFGLPHLTSRLIQFSNRWIMSEYFPEMILSEWLWRSNNSGLADPGRGMSYFFEPTVFDSCYLDERVKKWFELPPQTECLEFNLKIDREIPQPITMRAIDASGKVIATLSPITMDGSHEFIRSSDITAYITQKQSLYPLPSEDQPPFVPGPGALVGEISGHYVTPHGQSKPLLIVMRDESFKLIVNQEDLHILGSILEASPKHDETVAR